MKWLLGILAVVALAVVAALAAFAFTDTDTSDRRVDRQTLRQERTKVRLYMRDLELVYGARVTGMKRLGKDYWRVRFGPRDCVDVRLDRPRKREIEVLQVGRC